MNQALPTKLTLLLLITTIILSVGIIFSPVRSFNFINLDDNVFIVDNPSVNSGLTWDNVKWAFKQPYAGQWQPLTWISHMADVELYSLWPGGHHLTNILIHALSIVILFFVLIKIGTNSLLALILSLFWGLHPLRLESVAWVAERKDVLSIFFALGAVLTYLSNYRSRLLKLTIVTCLYALGLLSKPIIITFPVLLIILDFTILPKTSSWKIRIIEKIPLFGLAIVSAIITILAQQADQSLSSLSGISIQGRLALASTASLAYLAKYFWPTGGGIFYPIVNYPPGVGEGAFLACIILAYLAIKNFRNYPYYFLGLSWLVISSLPIIGIIHIGGQSLADRWTYLPHVGLTLAVAFYCNSKAQYLNYQLIAISLITIGFITFTIYQLPNWKNNQSIYTYTLQVSPNNFMAHTNLGASYDAEGRLDLAAKHFEEAARLNPTYPEALNNLGSLKARQGKLSEGIILFQEALRIRPDFISAQNNLNYALKLTRQ